MRLAAMLKRPVLFMSGLYLGGNRYAIHFERLADFSTLERSERDAPSSPPWRPTPPAWNAIAAPPLQTGSTSSISGASRMPPKT